MTFKYKPARRAHLREPAWNQQRQAEREFLSGIVQGLAASDIEERFSRALDKDDRVIGYTFREAVLAGRNLPGQLEVDFMIETAGGEIWPVQVDGEFAHKGASKRQEDALKDTMINDYYRRYGVHPVKRIDGDLLKTQKDANELVKEML